MISLPLPAADTKQNRYFWFLCSDFPSSTLKDSIKRGIIFVLSMDQESSLALHMLHVCVSRSVVSDSLQTTDYSPPGSSFHGIFPGKNTGVGCHFLLQGILPAQGSNPRHMSPALAGRFFTTSITWEAPTCSRENKTKQERAYFPTCLS